MLFFIFLTFFVTRYYSVKNIKKLENMCKRNLGDKKKNDDS